MERRRKPTPVAVIRFPARGTGAAKTVPEIRTLSITDAEATPLPQTPKRTLTNSRRATLTGERPEDIAKGMGQLAALGHRLFNQGRVQEARAIFEGLVASNPEDAFSHTMLGTIYLALNSFDRALALFEAALQIDPSDVAALVYRGEIRFQKRRLKAAVDDFKRAVTLGSADDPFVERARRLLKLTRRDRSK